MVSEAVNFCALEYKTRQSEPGSEGPYKILNPARLGFGEKKKKRGRKFVFTRTSPEA